MAQVEILTGHERCRSWSDKEKLAILSEVAAGEGSVAEIARGHDILAPQIYAWRRKFSRPAEPDDPLAVPVFLPVTVLPEVTHGHEAGGKNKASQRRSMNVEIRCKGGAS